MQQIEITKHALDRFLERQEGERLSIEAAQVAILRIFSHAQPIVFRDKFMQKRLWNNSGIPAQYYYHSGWIFVTTGTDQRRIVTMERQWSRRLETDFWYADESSTT